MNEKEDVEKGPDSCTFAKNKIKLELKQSMIASFILIHFYQHFYAPQNRTTSEPNNSKKYKDFH